MIIWRISYRGKNPGAIEYIKQIANPVRIGVTASGPMNVIVADWEFESFAKWEEGFGHWRARRTPEESNKDAEMFELLDSEFIEVR